MFVPTFGRSLRSLVPAMKIFPDGKRIIRFSAAMLISVASITLCLATIQNAPGKVHAQECSRPSAAGQRDRQTLNLGRISWCRLHQSTLVAPRPGTASLFVRADFMPLARSGGAKRPIANEKSRDRSPPSKACWPGFACSARDGFGRPDNKRRTRTGAA